MNTRQLQYALELSKDMNFSQVAERLNITQPALSKQISKLEKELGVQLFDRDAYPMKLTIAGEYFISEAEQLLYKEQQLLHTMDAFKEGSKGELVIGVSPFRSTYMLPPIMKKIKERYPDVRISLRELGSDELRKDAAAGKFDFAIVNLPVDELQLEYILLEPDNLVLAVPDNFLSLLNKKKSDKGTKIDFYECKELPFVVLGENQEMRVLFDGMCVKADFHPNIAMEVVGLTTSLTMVYAGIGAAILPLQFINHELLKDGVTLFSLNTDNFFRQPVIVMRREQYISKYAEYAIQLLKRGAEK